MTVPYLDDDIKQTDVHWRTPLRSCEFDGQYGYLFSVIFIRIVFLWNSLFIIHYSNRKKF